MVVLIGVGNGVSDRRYARVCDYAALLQGHMYPKMLIRLELRLES
jgi:hypothetical protein